MTTTRFCYHCSKHHPEDQMRQVDNKGIKRWRCVASIQAAKQAKAVRDNYGKQVTEKNKAEAKSKLKDNLNPELSYRASVR